MKKIFLGLLAIMVSVTLFAAPRTMEEAAQIAAQFTNQQPQLRKAHKSPRAAANMRLAHKALQNNSEAVAYYVFNQEGNNGFVIVSADDRTAEDVLGYTENGSFDMNTANPNLKWWLERYAEEITALQSIDESQLEPRKAVQAVTEIENLLVNRNGVYITWGQDAPYNNLCPIDEIDNTRCATGCVATATAQVMFKWRWPQQGTGSSSYTWDNCLEFEYDEEEEEYDRNVCVRATPHVLSADYGVTTYDWDHMLPTYTGKSSTTTQKNAVATLMYHCGVSSEMRYGGDSAWGSGTLTDYMAYALKTYFGYKFDKFVTMYSRSNYGSVHSGVTAEFGVSRNQIKSYFNADLEAGRPIIMGGEGNVGGHEFVCSGRDTQNRFYINFGWDGSGDGYYAITALSPGQYDFSSGLDAIIGLRPDRSDLPPVTVTWSVDGVTSTTEVVPGETATPETTPENCTNGKVFVGWTEESDVDGDRPADLFTTGKIINSETTFYAVFATEEEGTGTTTATYTPSSYFSNGQEAGSKEVDGVTFVFAKGGNSSGNQPKYYTTGTSVRMYAENTLTISAENEISAIAFTYGNTTTAGLEANTGTLSDSNWTGNSNSVTFTAGSSGQQYIKGIVVTVGGGASYSNYSLTCDGTTPEPVYYTIRFFDKGAQLGEDQSVLKNNEPDVPANPTAACEEYTFVGWWTAELEATNTDAKAWITNFKATKDQNYYAIYSKTEEGQGGSAAFDGQTAGTYKIYAQVGETKYYAVGNVKSGKLESTTNESEASEYTLEKVTDGFAIKYGTSYITYANSSTKTNLGTSTNPYTWDIETGTAGSWRVNATTGSGRALAFSSTGKFAGYSTDNIGQTVQGNTYYDLEIGGGAPAATIYYTSTVSCGATAIDNAEVAPKAVKVMENGQIVIIRDNEKYTIFGQKIQ